MIQIHQTAEIEDGAEIGDGTVIWHHCHVRRGASIGANCSLGRNVFVDSGVRIGTGTRIQNNVSIYRGVIIDNRVFIGPHVTFTNDLYPRAFTARDGWRCVPTLIGYGASIGAGVVVVCGNTVKRFAMVAAGAVVCRDIEEFELVARFSEHLGFVDEEGKRK